MKTLTVNVWGEKPGDASTKLAAAGVVSYREVPPFSRHTVDGVWAFAVDVDDDDLDSKNALLNAGWLLGVIGVARNVKVDLEVS